MLYLIFSLTAPPVQETGNKGIIFIIYNLTTSYNAFILEDCYQNGNFVDPSAFQIIKLVFLF